MFSIPRDEFYAFELKKREPTYTEQIKLNVLCASYNLAGNSPKEFDETCLGDLLRPTNADSRVDIYCIGMQEIVPLDARSWIAGDSDSYGVWESRLQRHLGEDEYQCLGREKLFGLSIYLFVHCMHSPHARHVCTQAVGAGLLGTGSNKGGVAIRLNLYNSSICFINSHLAAHQNEVDMRNSDYHTICNSLRFNLNAPVADAAQSTGDDGASAAASSMAELEFSEMEQKVASSLLRRYATLADHDFVFWLGDLNYRLDMPMSEVVTAVAEKNWATLLAKDQLLAQQAARAAFSEFAEMPIAFAPTYKFKTGFEKGGQFDNKESKPPSYCDRILYLPAAPDTLVPLHYSSVPACCGSDHKPVRAEFEMSVRFAMIEQAEAAVTEMKEQFDAWELAMLAEVPGGAKPIAENFQPDASVSTSYRSRLASAAASVSRSASSMAAGVSVLSGDSEYVSERIIRERRDDRGGSASSSSVGGGFASGFTELFSKPAEGAKSGGASGFFKGLAQGFGGLIAKPTASILDALSHSLHSAASSALGDIAPELVAAANDARYSLDGYLRLAWYHQTKSTPRPAHIVGSDAAQPGSVPPRIMQNLSENLLLSLKLCNQNSAILCSNSRLCIVGIPSDFAAVPDPAETVDEAAAASRAKKIERARIISSRTVAAQNISEQVEAQRLSLWLDSRLGMRSIDFRADAADEALVIQCVCVVANGDAAPPVEERWSHRIACASVQEAQVAAALLGSFSRRVAQLYRGQ